VAAGLIAGTTLKLAASLRTSVLGARAGLLLGGSTFVLVAGLRLPLLWVLATVGSLGVAWAWRVLRTATPTAPVDP
jgi:chromate transporter